LTGSAGLVYEDLIKEQLGVERAREASLGQRGAFVVTSSGALVTVLLGLAGFAAKSGTGDIPVSARALLAASAPVFLVAAICGLGINQARRYEEVRLSALRRIVDDPAYWNTTSNATALRRSSEVRVDILEAARKFNGDKARLLAWGLAFEVAGIGLVAAGAIVIAFSG
jgi:hypothetical protein